MPAHSKLVKPANVLLLVLLSAFIYLIYLHARARFLSPIGFDEESVVWGDGS